MVIYYINNNVSAYWIVHKVSRRSIWKCNLTFLCLLFVLVFLVVPVRSFGSRFVNFLTRSNQVLNVKICFLIFCWIWYNTKSSFINCFKFLLDLALSRLRFSPFLFYSRAMISVLFQSIMFDQPVTNDLPLCDF